MGKEEGARAKGSASAARVLDIEERTWLPRHCRGDGKAFPELVAAYRSPVYGYLVRCGVEESARDDLFQEVFLKIHAAASSYQPARPLRPWLLAIVANTVRNYLRSRRGHGWLAPDMDLARIPSPQPGAERMAELGETSAWLEQAIAALPFAQREVLVLTTVDGVRQQDVAEILQMPLGTVKTHLRRARLSLLQALEDIETPRDGETRR